jgi:hypothetical protein
MQPAAASSSSSRTRLSRKAVSRAISAFRASTLAERKAMVARLLMMAAF